MAGGRTGNRIGLCMKLLIDMNLSPQWVDIFASSGIEAVHWSAIGDTDSPDSEIMEYAQKHDYTVFTHDLDFGSILAITSSGKPSVIQLRMGVVIPDNIAHIAVSALKNLSDDIDKGALITIDQRKTRVSLLPLR